MHFILIINSIGFGTWFGFKCPRFTRHITFNNNHHGLIMIKFKVLIKARIKHNDLNLSKVITVPTTVITVTRPDGVTICMSKDLTSKIHMKMKIVHAQAAGGRLCVDHVAAFKEIVSDLQSM